jgi:hypothetical protein
MVSLFNKKVAVTVQAALKAFVKQSHISKKPLDSQAKTREIVIMI